MDYHVKWYDPITKTTAKSVVTYDRLGGFIEGLIESECVIIKAEII